LKHTCLESTSMNPSTNLKHTTMELSSLEPMDIESRIRKKGKLLVKRNLGTRFKVCELSDEELATLEQELLDDLKKPILEQIEVHRGEMQANNVANDDETEGILLERRKNCCEMIFYHENC